MTKDVATGWSRLRRTVADLARRPRTLRLTLAILVVILVASGASATAPLLLKYPIDLVAYSGLNAPPTAFWTWIALYVAALAVARAGVDLQFWLVGRLEHHSVAALRASRIAATLAAPIEYHLATGPGALAQHLNNAARAVTVISQTLFLSLLPTAVQLVATLYIAGSFISAPFAFILGITAIVYAISFSLGTNRVVKAHRSGIDSGVALTRSYTDYLQNIESLKLTGTTPFAMKNLGTYGADTERLWQLYLNKRLSFGLISVVIYTAAFGAALSYAAHSVLTGSITIGDFSMITLYMTQLLRPLEMIGVVHRELRQAVHMLDGQPDLPSPETPRIVGGAEAQTALDSHIRLQNIAFAYGNGKFGLQRINLEIQPQQLVCVVGRSGSGKSTLLRLLAGLYRPTSGVLTINGEDPLGGHRSVGVVPQAATLFDLSLYENVALGRKEVDERTASIALERLALGDLAPGMREPVGPFGARLSVGQRQRVGLSRVLVKPAQVILLDEPTAGLDAVSEQRIGEIIRHDFDHSTRIVVTHSRAMMELADVIIVMADGEIVSAGARDEVLPTLTQTWS